MTARSFFKILFIMILIPSGSYAQDTLQITYPDFVQRVMQNSGKLDFDRQDVALAENRIDQAQSSRWIPSVRLQTQHGLVPAVRSDSVLPWGDPLPKDEYYLDPNLRNDWNNWAIYNRGELSAVQPLYTWGAINKAVDAARKGAESARYQFEAQKVDMEIRLFELYFSYVLALEIERLLGEADDTIGKVERQINDMEEEGDPDLDISEVYKFRIFQSEFEIQREEVYRNLEFIQETWNYFLRDGNNSVYEPQVRFLDPVSKEFQDISFYQQAAFNNRPELKALKAGEEATDTYIESLKRQNLPGLFVGGYIRYANTPNRPFQDNPFIENTTNFFNGGFGFTIRQNLNFFQMRSNLERSRIELRKVSYARDAARDGVLLEVNNNYRKARVADIRVKRTDDALVTSKEWKRQEQQDYDFGIGEVKDLIDSMKKELELKLQLKQFIFEYNKSLAELNKSAGIPLTTLITN
ncbi:TolC family protein [Balneola sp. MJW-20]|uniref:TolC family protein n=1 Tax=Gracilimonas aurantiaca TaxID=3234185 RepID=UPI003466AD5F